MTSLLGKLVNFILAMIICILAYFSDGATVAAEVVVFQASSSQNFPPKQIVRVSKNAKGIQANGPSPTSTVSADGHIVVFVSYALNLIPGRVNGYGQVYAKNLITNQVMLVSADSNGVEGNGESSEPSISADGNSVVFTSNASNLVANLTNGISNVFLKDISAGSNGAVTLISADVNNVEGNGNSTTGTISANGQWVAFCSGANNLVANDTNKVSDVFIKNVKTGAIKRVSTSATGGQANGKSYLLKLAISSDGKFVVFSSEATNLVKANTNGKVAIFLKNVDTGAIQLISSDQHGTPADGDSLYPSLSSNGRLVAFDSNASNLVPGDTNNSYDIFVKDRLTGGISRISTSAKTIQARGNSLLPSLSGDGRYVAFASVAPNLVPGGNAGVSDVYVKALATGEIKRVSVNAQHVAGNMDSGSLGVTFSQDGRYIVFDSSATNLDSKDTNGTVDVFIAPNVLFK